MSTATGFMSSALHELQVQSLPKPQHLDQP
jgi:hypothetical protein